MAQEEKKELSTAGTLRTEGKVRPREDVHIYAVDSKSGAHLGKPGTKHTVHAVLAKQLIDKGAATMKAPAEKSAKLTDEQLKALEETLGRKAKKADVEAELIRLSEEGGDTDEDLV